MNTLKIPHYLSVAEDLTADDIKTRALRGSNHEISEMIVVASEDVETDTTWK